jgi:YVTN family beta-propeller protein
MRARSLLLLGFSLLSLLLILGAAPAQPRSEKRPGFKSPLGLAVDQAGQRAYVALHTASSLAVVDLKSGTVLRELAVGRAPFDVAVAKETIYVTCEAEDTLVSLDPTPPAVRRRLPLGQGPRGIAVGSAPSRWYVACRDSALLAWADGTSDRLHSRPLPPWPDRMAVTPDGQTLFVLSAAAGQEAIAAVPTSPADAAPRMLPLPGASNLRGLAVTPAGDALLVVHQRPKANIPTTQVAQGWVFTNAVSLLRWPLDKETPAPQAAILDEPNRGFADPSDVVVTPDGRRAFIACAGADAVLALDLKRLKDYLAGLKPVTGPYAAGDDLTASRRYVIARLETEANPRRLALSGDGQTLVVSNYLADSLTVIDAVNLQVVRHISLGGPPPDAARRGEILFHSGKMTFQGQFTCASCHPNGEADGLNWDLTRDGLGNFKNTKSLLGGADTEPYGWHGSSPTLADRVAGTLRTLHRHEPAGTERDDLAAYLQTLLPPRPLPGNPARRPARERGRAVFEGKGQCATCHQRAGGDDGKAHHVGTRSGSDTQDRFDTPALRGVARTAPYLHDGRAATLEEVFTKHNARQLHGAAHRLTPEELADLVVYLKSL